MAKIRKTSKYGKRKIKPLPPVVKPVYPEYIQNFIDKVESTTPYVVKVDQYTETNSYHVGVLKKIDKVHRCVWMASFVDEPKWLEVFWTSESFKNS
jgi:succinate dehydrogenase/fumarate reductase-like Fe-S protein